MYFIIAVVKRYLYRHKNIDPRITADIIYTAKIFAKVLKRQRIDVILLKSTKT